MDNFLARIAVEESPDLANVSDMCVEITLLIAMQSSANIGSESSRAHLMPKSNSANSGSLAALLMQCASSFP